MVDTTFVIDVMRNDGAAVAKARQLAAESSTVELVTPRVFELYVGVSLSLRADEERAKVLETLGP